MVDKPIEKQLKINLQKYVNATLRAALPLCIILSEDKNYSWFYEHYIQIYGYISQDGIGLQYVEVPSYGYKVSHDSVIHMESISYELVGNMNILDIIRENIVLSSYVISFVDEYYLTNRQAYKKKHLVHEFLLYGYDDIKQELMVVAFDSNKNFNKIKLKYDDFKKAFENGKMHYKKRGTALNWIAEQSVIVIKYNQNLKDRYFDIKEFLKQLNNCINCKIENSEKYLIENDILYNRQIKFGLDVYDLVIYYFKNMIKNKFGFNYNTFHLLYENKFGIFNRLKYVIKTYSSDELVKLVREYDNNIVKRLNTVRLMYIKLMIINDEVKLNDSIKRIIDIVNSVSTSEKVLLPQIYNQLYNKFREL